MIRLLLAPLLLALCLLGLASAAIAQSLHNPAQRIAYDLDGQVISVETGVTAGQSDAAWAAFAMLRRTDTVYDAQARKARDTEVMGSTVAAMTQYAWDAEGRALCTAVRMNAAAWAALPASACDLGTEGAYGPDRISRNGYDAADRLTTTHEAWGTALQHATLTQAWTPNGQVDWIEDANGNRSDYGYDGFDRLARLEFPSPTVGAHAANPADYEAYNYDANDNPVSKRVRSGEVFTTSFDTLDRVTYVDAPPGTSDLSFAYDLLDRRLTATQPGVQTLTSTWDALGRNTSETGPLGTIANQYDLAGRRIRRDWPDGNWVGYAWNLSGAMTQAQVGGFLVLGAISYDDLGRRTQLARGNGVTTTYGYDAAGRLGSLSHDLAGTAYDVSYGLTYNPAGQALQRTVSNPAYDHAPGMGTTAYVNNGLNQPVLAEGTPLSWDGRGNLISDGMRSYGYDAANRLVSGGGSGISYDPLDRLHQLTGTGGGLFQYDGGQLAGVYGGPGAIAEYWVGGPEPDEWLFTSTPAAWFWPIQDAQGSVVALTDYAGAATAINTYDEYGRPGPGNIGRMGYTGQMALPDAGLQSYKARAYHAALGRFVQTDPAGYEQGLNLYAYVGNDPVNATDPTGMVGCPIEVSACEQAMFRGAQDSASTMTLGQGAIVMGILVAPTAAIMAPAAGAAALGNPIAITQGVAVAGEIVAPGAGLAAGAAAASRVSTLRPGPYARESIPVGPGRLRSLQQADLDGIGGPCHTCGATNPGTSSGKWVGDHQRPTRLITPGQRQRAYPHCLDCSRRQGGEVRAAQQQARQQEINRPWWKFW